MSTNLNSIGKLIGKSILDVVANEKLITNVEEKEKTNTITLLGLEIQDMIETRGNQKLLSLLALRHQTDQSIAFNLIDEALKNTIGDNVFITDIHRILSVFMVGFGICDKNSEFLHNVKLLKFLKEAKSTKIIEAFTKFWDDPIGSPIKPIPGQRIYESLNQFVTFKTVKVKSRATKLLVLRTPWKNLVPIDRVTLTEATEINWNNLYLKFTGLV